MHPKLNYPSWFFWQETYFFSQNFLLTFLCSNLIWWMKLLCIHVAYVWRWIKFLACLCALMHGQSSFIHNSSIKKSMINVTSYVVPVKSTVEISQNFVAFSEYTYVWTLMLMRRKLDEIRDVLAWTFILFPTFCVKSCEGIEPFSWCLL